MEKNIIEQFKKKMKLDGDFTLILDIDEYGNWEQEGTIMEKGDNGKVWAVTFYKTGKIKSIVEV